jgi:gamma-glutamyltranspeptidase/glutathione hydrolase
MPRWRRLFALAVTHPSAGNIGGGGFMIIRLANGNRNDDRPIANARRGKSTPRCTFDAGGKIDRTADRAGLARARSVAGHRCVAVELAHKKYGKLPWADVVVMPAADLATNGWFARAGARAIAQQPASARSAGTSGKMMRFPTSAAAVRQATSGGERVGGK